MIIQELIGWMKTQENIFQFINEDSLPLSLKWTLDPFPHAIIDNFLIQEGFDRITNDLRESPKSEVIQRQFGLIVDVQTKKVIYNQFDVSYVTYETCHKLGKVELRLFVYVCSIYYGISKKA